MSQEFSFTLPYDSFDLELIGLGAEDVGSSDFSTKVSEFFARQFAKFGGKARVVLNDTDRTIQVTWSKAEGFQEPLDMALSLLRSGRLSEAIPLLWTLHQKSPNDTDLLYNLGVAHSELGQIPRAIDVLKRLIALAPNHVHGLVALGIAYIRAEKLQFGEDHLRRALEQEPGNPWALKNLGACLLKQGRFEDAVPILEEAVRVSPKDLQAILGLGQAYEALGRIPEADDRYLQAIQIGGPPALTEFAKERRTAIAHEVMRDRSEFRPDVVMYMVGALDRFASMSKKEIQKIGFEIAILGQQGLDINDPEPKYTLRTLSGPFSGLHLVSIMYAAFKQFAPNEDVGIDLSNEYQAALATRR